MFTIYLSVIFLFANIFDASYQESENVSDYDHEYVPRVVNGYPAKLGDAPYQVAFKQQAKRSRIFGTFCGGTIVSETKLISAAHCFSNAQNFCNKICGGSSGNKRSLTKLYAVAGNLRNHGYYNEIDTERDGQWRKLKSLFFPSNYKFPKNDIAVLYTEKPFVFNNYVNYIPYAHKRVDYHGQCLVSGFGRISKKETSDKLLLAHLTLVPMKKCNKIHSRNMRHLVCTSSSVTDVGKGDSGGPLVCANTGDPEEKGDKGILVGVVSGHRYNVGSFFTRVSSFTKYIETSCQCSVRELSVTLFVIIITIPNLLVAILNLFNLFQSHFLLSIKLDRIQVPRKSLNVVTDCG